MDETMELAQKGAISGVRWVQWFFSVGKRVDHAALAAAAAALILLRSPAAQHLARQQSKLGRTFRTLHLFVPRFPLFFVLGPVMFVVKSKEAAKILGGSVSCPTCETQTELAAQSESWPVLVNCVGCGARLTIVRLEE